jgi:cobalt-zinc-cadmium efflux system outer membrane protein
MLTKKNLLLVLLSIAVGDLQAQIHLTEEDAVSKALKNSKNVAAALLVIQQQQQLSKTTFNIPNPEVFVESPTGLFYTGNVTQALAFPTVYAKQYQLQKQQIGLAESEKNLTSAQVGYQVRLLYLKIQYTDSLRDQLYLQDTIYSKLVNSAQRLFDAGQIDYFQKTVVETQYGEVHNQYEQAWLSYASLVNQLKYIADIKDSLTISPFKAYPIPQNSLLLSKDTALINQNTELLISKQTEAVSKKKLELQRNKALPGLAFGYFNQGNRNTPTNLRFRFGVTVPLWFWQYKGNIDAAKTELAVSQQRSAGLQQQLFLQLLQANNELALNNQSLTYYQNTGLKKSNAIISTARRLLASGENDYISFLRNINDAYNIRLKYLEAIKNYNQSILTINYLSGKL